MIVGVTVTRTGITPPQGAVARSALAFMRAVRLHHGDCRRGAAMRAPAGATPGLRDVPARAGAQA